MAFGSRLVSHLYRELPDGEEEIRAHFKVLSYIAEAPDHQKELFDHLYSCLSVLDSKAAALLTFDSIILAVFALLLDPRASRVEWYVATIGMVLLLVSAFLLLSVIWVHWSTTRHLGDYDEHAKTLLRVRRARTIRYRLAWDFAVLSNLFLLVLVIFKISGW